MIGGVIGDSAFVGLFFADEPREIKYTERKNR
jgi:hypothetical protein